jgi:hypothetical protein
MGCKRLWVGVVNGGELIELYVLLSFSLMLIKITAKKKCFKPYLLHVCLLSTYMFTSGIFLTVDLSPIGKHHELQKRACKLHVFFCFLLGH